MKIHAIVNLKAGTALGLSPEGIVETVKAPFVAKGHDIEVETLPPEAIEGAIAAAARRGLDVLLVGGGDGTVRTAARTLVGSETALGILPLGTMNRLAKDLEIPLRLDEAAACLADAHVTRIDVARVNGRLFLCNSLMGLTLRYSAGRQRLRGRPARERLPAYAAIIRNVLSSRRKISITVDHGSDRLHIRALSVAVTNNGYDETTTMLRRPKLDGGKLTMYVSKHRSGWGLAKALARAALGRWDGDPEMAKLTGSEFVISSPKRRIRLANDGELGMYKPPLTYTIEPRALKILTGRTPEVAETGADAGATATQA